jgi:hypothetical protein
LTTKKKEEAAGYITSFTQKVDRKKTGFSPTILGTGEDGYIIRGGTLITK